MLAARCKKRRRGSVMMVLPLGVRNAALYWALCQSVVHSWGWTQTNQRYGGTRRPQTTVDPSLGSQTFGRCGRS